MPRVVHARPRAGLLLALSFLVVLTSTGGAVLAADAAPPQAAPMVTNAELRQMARTVSSGLSSSEAGALGVTLARRNTVARALGVTLTRRNRQLAQDMADRLGQYLAAKQLEWQGNRAAGIDPMRLAEQLNAHLETASGPDYLRIRPEHLARCRMDMWLRLPELSTGLERKHAPGVPQFPLAMSPFEAYVVADWAVASKILNPAFTRTDAQEHSARLTPPPELTPGLHVVFNPRAEEFARHVSRVAGRKWTDVDSAMLAVASALETSYVR